MQKCVDGFVFVICLHCFQGAQLAGTNKLIPADQNVSTSSVYQFPGVLQFTNCFLMFHTISSLVYVNLAKLAMFYWTAAAPACECTNHRAGSK